MRLSFLAFIFVAQASTTLNNVECFYNKDQMVLCKGGGGGHHSSGGGAGGGGTGGRRAATVAGTSTIVRSGGGDDDDKGKACKNSFWGC